MIGIRIADACAAFTFARPRAIRVVLANPLHIMAVVQLRNPTQGRAYFDAKKAAGYYTPDAAPAPAALVGVKGRDFETY